MGVIAKYIYEVKPGRAPDFFARLRAAAAPQFASPVMPKSGRLLRSTVPGPDQNRYFLTLEYADMAAYGARNAWEGATPAWRALFDETPEAPQRLLSVELLSDVEPTWATG
jgi:hypothetical protein